MRAPFDGITGLASVEIGDRIATDDMIGNFDDRSSILVEFDLPEALAGAGVHWAWRHGDNAFGRRSRSFEGEISAIDSRVNAATRTARVRASIDNTADLLAPGRIICLAA